MSAQARVPVITIIVERCKIDRMMRHVSRCQVAVHFVGSADAARDKHWNFSRSVALLKSFAKVIRTEDKNRDVSCRDQWWKT